jgi:hypothetical protein
MQKAYSTSAATRVAKKLKLCFKSLETKVNYQYSTQTCIIGFEVTDAVKEIVFYSPLIIYCTYNYNT